MGSDRPGTLSRRLMPVPLAECQIAGANFRDVRLNFPVTFRGAELESCTLRFAQRQRDGLA
jgi:uncharacterized protein YjbI with pentapeptide repeats